MLVFVFKDMEGKKHNDSNRSGQQILAGAAKAASYSMILQLMLRLMTFGLNAFVLRFISKELLGVVNVRLTLLYSTILFLATEAFDKACLSGLENQNWSKIINLMWCTLPFSMIVSGLLGWIWIYMFERPNESIIPNYQLGVVSFAVSTVLVILSRPLYVIGQKLMFVKLKVVSAGIAELSKGIITIMLVLIFPYLGLINFAIAQVIYGTVMSTVYYGYFIYYINRNRKKDDNFPFTSIRALFPSKLKDENFVDFDQAWLTWSIFKQSFLKQFLTEGEKYVMTIFGVLNFADQGVYDVVNNLGSMAARFIFMPIEESGFLFFSQLLFRGKPLKEQSRDNLQLATDVLSSLLKLVVLIGLIILVFGYAYSELALDLYGGSMLSLGPGPNLLRWYCLYVLVIAVNGTTECFVFAIMSKEEVDRYNYKMLIFSGIFLGSSLIFTNVFGSVGFILANCLNMAARIIHSAYFIQNYFKGSSFHPLQGIIPARFVVIALLLSFIVTTISMKIACCDKGIMFQLFHIAVGAVCGVMTLAVIYLKETELIQFVLKQYRSRKAEKTE